MQAAKTLVARGANPNALDDDLPTWRPDTPLKHAVNHGDAEMVDLLLCKGMWYPDLQCWWWERLVDAVVEEVRLSSTYTCLSRHAGRPFIHPFNETLRILDDEGFHAMSPLGLDR